MAASWISVRRAVCAVLLFVLGAQGGYHYAYNSDEISDRLGGLGGFAAIVALVVFGTIVVAWPDGKAPNMRRLVTAGALVAACFVSGFISDAWEDTPFSTLGWIAGGLVAFLVLLVGALKTKPMVAPVLKRFAPAPTPPPVPVTP